SANLLEVDNNENNIHVSGFISSPLVTRSSSRMIKVFVNNRLVSDRGITSAIFNGYRGNLMKSRFPLAVLYITLPFDNVDINVHPAKNEVRFFDGKNVYNAVVKAVKDGLEQTREKFYKDPLAPEEPKISEPSNDSQIPYISKIPESKTLEIVEESLFKYTQPDPPVKYSIKQEVQKPFIREIDEPVEKPVDEPVEKLIEKPVEEPAEKSGGSKEAQANYPDNYQGNIFVKAQVMSTYIIAETEDGMILVDQHAAHERIIYEKLKAGNQNAIVQSQTLLMPETLELGFREADLLSQIVEDLSKYGFDIEPFGGTTFIVKAVPAIVDKKETAPFILEMIDSLIDKKTSTLKNQWLEDTLILMACHSAIKANQKLSTPEMEQLLIDLKKCDNPFHCPHGRPTMIRWGKKDMEKMF
ncbi:MAG: DNA mismatch repair protein MutL, partial [Desulfobacteraceae bacterium]|nr:DNA mismatch repair protein MutL [Desulfobacteraceae bacterium]